MKAAVILGVFQMLLGTCMKGMNALYFKDYTVFFFECLPQIALMVALFGFMDYLIVVKWLTEWKNTATAPAVVQTIITMFIGMGEKQPGDETENIIEN